MNVKRGYIRLAIAVAGSWAMTWSAIAAFAGWQQGIYSNLFVEGSQRGDPMETLIFPSKMASEYGEMVGDALAWGLVGTPTLALLFAIGWWVYRGFVQHD